jgi:acetyl coenzyme A synthetase (ADP forming)-like protein
VTSISLDALFRPRSVAVVGASRRRGTIGGEIFHNLVSNGFEGPVHPVNPHADWVQSVRAYRSIVDVPGEVDLAVLAVPREEVLGVVDECAQKGVRGLVVVSAGFRETGEAGAALEEELVRRVRAHGMRMIGPNCLGILSTDPAVRLDATFAPTFPPAGDVAFSSQSGAFGLAILDYARDLGIGISEFASVGNKADVSGNDLIESWETDPRTKVILLYLESFGNPRRFLEIARRVGRQKPIAVVKSGRTTAGARAAGSHTGALAGRDVAVAALLGQAGVIRADTIEELFDVAMLLATQPIPSGRRVAILTNAGGPGIMAADACGSHGLVVAPLARATEEALRAFLPAAASATNPVDMIASADAGAYERAIRLLLGDPGIDALLVLFVPPLVTEAAAVADAIRRAAAGAQKPVAACLMGSHGVPVALSSLREGRIPSYRFPESAAIALGHAARHGEWLRRPAGVVPELADVRTARARAAIGTARGGRWLEPSEVAEVLAAFGISLPRTIHARTIDEAVRAAAQIGGAVAVKLASTTVVHKTEFDGVALDVQGAAGVRAAWERMFRRLSQAGRGEEMEGVLVQPMVPHGVETFVGVSAEPRFGSLVAFGIGGVHVELFHDVVFRIAPLTDVDAKEMVDGIRAQKLLDGFRGTPPADRAALADAVLRISRLATELRDVVELDLNPLVAREPGRGVVAIDARIRVGG